MTRALRSVGFMVAVLYSVTAAAQSVSPPATIDPEPQRVAILILATSGVDAELADSLTELLIGAAATRGGLAIIGKEEFQARLAQDEGRSLECIGSAACLGRVGVELEVDQVIAGTVGRSRRGWIYNLNRIDIRSGELVGRAFQEVRGGVTELAASLQQSFPRLYRELQRRASLEVAADVPRAEVWVDGIVAGRIGERPMRLRELSAGEHEITIRAPGYETWTRQVELSPGETLRVDVSLAAAAAAPEPALRATSALVWVGLSVAVAGAASASIFGSSSQGEPTAGLTRQAAIEEVEARRRDADIAHISLGTLGAGVILGVVGLILSDFGASAAESPDGAGDEGGLRGGAAVGRHGVSVSVRGSL